MAHKQTRPLTLDESKLMFRLTMESAQAGVLGRLRVRHFALGAFGLGVTLGAFPAARRILGTVLLRYLSAKSVAPP